MPLFAAKVASVIALVLQLRGGLALLEVLDKGMDFGLVKDEGSALESLACVAEGHLPTPLASWY